MNVKEMLQNRCPIKETLEIINRKWAVIILWDISMVMNDLMNSK